MIRVSTVRYFLAVTPPPGWLIGSLLAGVSLGCWIVILSPRDIDAAFAWVLLLQLLSGSNGYRAAASRGFLDPLVVSGRSRQSIAAASLVAAAVPGIVAWAALVGAALYAGPEAWGRALTLQRAAALAVVCGVAWTLGQALPRLPGPALWAALMIAIAMSDAPFGRFVASADIAASTSQVLVTAAAAIASPLLLLGDAPGMRDARVVGCALMYALALVAVAVRLLSRSDLPLLERS
jgi:hypothetical protein